MLKFCLFCVFITLLFDGCQGFHQSEDQSAIMYKDSSVYEVRQYRLKSKIYDNLSPEELQESFEFGKEFMSLPIWKIIDIVYIHSKIPGIEPIVASGRDYPGGFQPDNYEKQYPGEVVYLSWVIRFDNMNQRHASWAKVFADPDFKRVFSKHPFVHKYIHRLESRFMNAVVRKPSRNQNSSKVYETINYTVDTDKVAWTHQTRDEFVTWLTRTVSTVGSVGNNLVSAFVAQVPAKSIVRDGTKGLRVLSTEYTKPQITMTFEWDNQDAMDRYYLSQRKIDYPNDAWAWTGMAAYGVRMPDLLTGNPITSSCLARVESTLFKFYSAQKMED